jgi:hypothetical protein
MKGSQWSWSYGSLIYNYLCNQRLPPLKLCDRIQLRRCVLDTIVCDKVCQWLAGGQWISLGTQISSTNKTETTVRWHTWQSTLSRYPDYKPTVFALVSKFRVINRETTNTHFIVFGFTRTRAELLTRAHRFTSDLFLFFWVFVLCLVCPMLPLSLDCPFLIALSVLFNI